MRALCWAMVAVVSTASTAQASVIRYEVTNVAGSTWQYDYSVANNSLGGALQEFSVFFELGLYANLAFAAAPDGWDALAVQPSAELPDNGFFDALAVSDGIAPGAELGGFSVRFDWLGTGTPGAQAFNVVDPVTLDIVESGQTVPLPEPGALALVLVALGTHVARQGIRRRTNP